MTRTNIYPKLDFTTISVQLFTRNDTMKTEKKEIVVETARSLFTRFGFNKTTIDEIARDSFVAKSTIYNYFDSKEEIFNQVIEKEASILFNEINTALVGISDPFEKLRTYATTRMSHIKKLTNLYTVLYDEYLGHYSLIEKARKKSLEKEITLIKNIFQEGIDRGVFEKLELNLISLTIITAWSSLDFPWTKNIELPDTVDNINYLMDVLFNGIRKR